MRVLSARPPPVRPYRVSCAKSSPRAPPLAHSFVVIPTRTGFESYAPSVSRGMMTNAEQIAGLDGQHVVDHLPKLFLPEVRAEAAKTRLEHVSLGGSIPFFPNLPTHGTSLPIRPNSLSAAGARASCGDVRLLARSMPEYSTVHNRSSQTAYSPRVLRTMLDVWRTTKGAVVKGKGAPAVPVPTTRLLPLVE